MTNSYWKHLPIFNATIVYYHRVVYVFTFSYYTNQSCSNGDQCPYLHHTPQEVIPIHGARHLEYFMGMTRTSRTCRYYLRGNCPNKDTCPYIHDRALVVQHQRSGDIR